MANEPENPTDDPNNPDSEDSRADQWEAAFFSPDGEQIGRKSTATSAPAPHDNRSEVPTVNAPSLPLADGDEALRARLQQEAQQSVEKHADDLGEALHEKFMHLLTAKVSETGGHLTAQDVKEMGAEFKSQMEDIKTAFLDAVESYTQARERSRIESARTNLFTRLMVRKFEHRFRDEKTLHDNPDFLSRRMIPGFSNMLSMMFGKPRLASYEKRARAVAERIRNEHGGQIDWDEFYNAPEVKKLALSAEIEIAKNFQQVDKRLQWMIAMLNSNLIPADDRWHGAEWTFSREAATKLLTSLFADLRAALKNPNARRRFSDSLGEETLTILDGVSARFS